VGESMPSDDNIIIYPNVSIGPGARIDPFVILGRPPEGASPGEFAMSLGNEALIRSHTVIYAGANIGHEFQTGHHVLIRQGAKVGDHCSIGSGTVVEFLVEIGSGVRLHSNVFVPEFCHLEDNCWIGPGAALTNAKYPASPDVKRNLKGVWVKKGAIVGAGVVILPGIVIGEGALVGAGSVVTSDVQPGIVVAGNPARVIGETKQLRDAETGRLIYGERSP
jgi:acetyltransferase-like isoleucine patch superfamily enzyme